MPFHLTSRVTDIMPETGGRLLDNLLFHTAGSQRLVDHFYRQDMRRIHGLQSFDRLLVISDLNIGDAVNMQAAIAALREYFPDASIDYIVNRAAASLIDGNPDISHLYPVFTRAPVPEMSDLRNLAKLCEKQMYDLIINFSPFFKRKQLAWKKQAVVDYRLMASMLVHNQRDPETINHVIWQSYYYIHRLLSERMNPAILKPFTGTRVTLSARAITQAEELLANYNFPAGKELILYNPDASSRFTRLPIPSQVALLKQILKLDVQLLLGAGHQVPDIHRQLLGFLPERMRERVTVVPASVPFDTYAALLDHCAVFITGDSGPLHVGAARKKARDGSYHFRNRTAIFSIFGATPARIYGYDTQAPGFMPANQDAPARTYIAESPCRNMTCINKRAKICREVRCFQQVPVTQIGKDVEYYLRTKTLKSVSNK